MIRSDIENCIKNLNNCSYLNLLTIKYNHKPRDYFYLLKSKTRIYWNSGSNPRIYKITN